MNGKWLILGGGGQVGQALAAQLGTKSIVFDRAQADFLSTNFIAELDKAVGASLITAVINAAAYTLVDKAESETDISYRLNHVAVAELAAWCKNRGIPLVHYSTDYVFDGSGENVRDESAATNPLNVYGASKLAGEQAIIASGAQHLILRTSWVYDASSKNFFTTMMRLFAEKTELRVVADQIGAPTYAPHLAQATILALEGALRQNIFPSGIYHAAGSGEVSWHGFAGAIFALAKRHDSGISCKVITPISSQEYPTPAKRPLNSRLNCAKLKEQLGVVLPSWEKGLEECAAEYYANNRNNHCRT